MNNLPKPFMKWAGGKSKLLDHITKKLPNDINTYYEPFLGGGAVYFEIYKTKNFKSAVLGDKCHELMNTWHVVRDNVKDLIELLTLPYYEYSRESYLEIRNLNPINLNPIERAARTIYLNRTCFNGLYRVNNSGKFNTPFGKYTNPVICDSKNLISCSEALSRVELFEGDFEDMCTDAGIGDVIYYDPPYMPTSKTSKFTNYTPGGFSSDDQIRLLNMFKKFDNHDVVQVLSNSSNDEVYNLFNGYEINSIINPCSMASPEKRKHVSEVLINNWW